MKTIRCSFVSVYCATVLWLSGYPASVSAATVTVNVGDNFFSPASATINVNDTVNWSWIGFSQHSSTSNTGLWDSGIFGRGHTFSRQFTAAGNFPYFCRVHPFQTGSVSVQAANAPPTVTITSPSNNAVLNAPASFTLTASASDPDGSVAQVQFLQGTTSLGIDTSSPYSVTVNNLAAGTYGFWAVATDNAGAKATNSITILVNALPTVAILAPTNGATLAAPWTGTIEAAASDSDGTVARVEFFSNSTSLGSVVNAPYDLAVTNIAAGTYTLTAVATDNRGATNTSPAVTIFVVTPVPIVLGNPRRLSATEFQFSYTAHPGLNYVVESSSHLANFTAISTNAAGAGSVTFTDHAATNNFNFYRVRPLPNP